MAANITEPCAVHESSQAVADIPVEVRHKLVGVITELHNIIGHDATPDYVATTSNYLRGSMGEQADPGARLVSEAQPLSASQLWLDQPSLATADISGFPISPLCAGVRAIPLLDSQRAQAYIYTSPVTQ